MSQPPFSIGTPEASEEVTGRYIVTFRGEDPDLSEGLAALHSQAGIAAAKLPNAAEFAESAMDMEQADSAGGAVFPTLGIAVVTLDDDALQGLMAAQAQESGGAILDIEPERIFYALNDAGGLSLAYLQGYRDAVDHLYRAAMTSSEEAAIEAAATFADDSSSTWGLKATRATDSIYDGSGIKVAVLDTGMALEHPDFRGRQIVSSSFVAGEEVADGQGHGTHCIGTACGYRSGSGRRYGAAYRAGIYAGKVLGNSGRGSTSGILAGMEWAITSGCQVVSMSLGSPVTTPSTAYETVGKRALQRGCLVVAAAGNNRPGTVNQPANSASIMAVGAIDSRSRLGYFSCGSGSGSGASVDIAGPGVAVYSATKLPQRYTTLDGTSMATPHVAGVAALWAQVSSSHRGAALWQVLASRALRLGLSAKDVGAGLVQAP